MKYLSLILLAPFMFAWIACTNHRDLINDITATPWKDYQNPKIEQAYLKDSLPAKLLRELSPINSHGVKVTYASGKMIRYFTYEADTKTVVSILPRLPFSIHTNFPIDTAYQKKIVPFSLSGMSLLSSEEQRAASFFWRINPLEFDYYECRKGKDLHTILVNKTNATILHRIESV